MTNDWDTMRLAYYDERVIEKMAEVSGVDQTSVVADVGTGTGFVAAGITLRVKRVVGTENAPAMLEVARENLRTLGTSNVDLAVGESRDCPWRTARRTPRSPAWSYTTPRSPQRCSKRWPVSSGLAARSPSPTR